MGKIHRENVWEKFMGKSNGENLWGKLMGNINGTFQHCKHIEKFSH